MENMMNHLPDADSGIVLYTHRIPVPGVQRKILYHFSDIHLAYTDPAEVGSRVMDYDSWAAGWPGFSRQYGEPWDKAQMKEPAEHLSSLLTLASSGDTIVLTGDLCDKVNETNLSLLEEKLKAVTVPFMAVCGNHDMAHEIPDGYVFSGMNQPVQTLDLGDLLIVGIDNSTRQVTGAQNEQLRRLLSLDKPILLIMHVPVMTEGNRDILLHCGDYFRLNHPDATEETLAFIELLKANAGKIAAVLAGHLHFHNESEIAPGLPQFVTSQGVLGNINRYEIGE